MLRILVNVFGIQENQNNRLYILNRFVWLNSILVKLFFMKCLKEVITGYYVFTLSLLKHFTQYWIWRKTPEIYF